MVSRPLTLLAGASLTLLLAATAGALATHEGAHEWVQTGKLWNPQEGHAFGQAIAVDDETLVVNEASARVQVYEQTNQGTWTNVQTLEAPRNPFEDDGPWGHANGQAFGSALALDAEARILAVGAPGFDVTGNLTDHETDAGAVYLYERAPNGTWELAERFVGPVNGDWNDDGEGGNDNRGPGLGSSVAVRGNVAVAGARDAVVDGDPMRGMAEIYELQGDGSWTKAEQFTSPNPHAATWDRFGLAIAIAGDQVAIGSPGEVSGTGSGGGAVHIYEHGEENWQHASRLTPALAYVRGGHVHLPSKASTHLHSIDHFGHALAVDGDGSTLVVGAPQGGRLAGIGLPTSTDWDASGLPLGTLDGPLTHPWGAAFVFERRGGGWSHEATLENPDREAHSDFGWDLNVEEAGDTVLVGASRGNQSEAVPANDHGVVTSRPSTGAAYVFESTSEGWACSDQLRGDDTSVHGPWGDQFGSALAITGTEAFVGAPGNGADRQGTVYEFEASGPTAPGSLSALDGLSDRCGPSPAPGGGSP